MTTLPSFVELMSSLGLDNSKPSSPSPRSRSSSCSSVSSPVHPPIITISGHPHKSQSNPSLRELDLDRRPGPSRKVSRYSPYYATVPNRRGSMPSMTNPARELERTLRPYSVSPKPSSPRSSIHTLSPSPRSSSETLSMSKASTPISTYVRRKTPHASPTSPSFPQHRPPADIPSVLSIPTLPAVLCNQSPPLFNERCFSASSSPSVSNTPLPEISEEPGLYSTCGHHTGVRLSAAPRRVSS